MSNVSVKGRIVEAGDVDDGDGGVLPRCVVVQFDSEKAVRDAVQGASIQTENDLGGADRE